MRGGESQGWGGWQGPGAAASWTTLIHLSFLLESNRKSLKSCNQGNVVTVLRGFQDPPAYGWVMKGRGTSNGYR